MAKPDRLAAPPAKEDNAVKLQVSPPQVRVRVPEIKIPEIKVPEANVTVDTAGIADAINALGQVIIQIAQQQNAILQMIDDHHAVLNKALGNQPDIKVEAPKVNMPARPRSFTVEVDDGSAEPTYMRIRADTPN